MRETDKIEGVQKKVIRLVDGFKIPSLVGAVERIGCLVWIRDTYEVI